MKVRIYFILFCTIFLSWKGESQVSGSVFRDFNGNGTRQTTTTFNEVGVGGIVVTAFNSLGLSATTTTLADGSFSFPNSGVTAAGEKLRIEFSGWNSSEYSGPSGTSSVQFLTAGMGVANFGINYPADYLKNENPELVIPCYVGGSRQTGSNFANLDVFVSYPWDNSGQTTQPDHDANYNTLGAVWGTAIQRSTKKIFASSFLKRHSSLGPGGLGAIYQIDYSSGGLPTVSTLVDLKAAPFNLNLGTFNETDVARFLSPTSPVSEDPEAFGKVGKIGLGNLTISDDERTLYTINLFDKKLVKIQIGLPVAAPVSGDVEEFVLPTPSCTLGTTRPFAVTFYKGLVYVGMVCSAENGGTVNDIFAHVYTFNPSTSAFTLLPGFPIPLNYTKGASHYNTTTMVGTGTAWNPWSDIATEHNDFSNGSAFIRYPTPVLSDIDFSADGDYMVLGFMDRASHQWGYLNRRPDGVSGLYYYHSGGDILMAYNNSGTWQLESNGSVGSLNGCGVNNSQGPGGGEFFCNDHWSNDHQEISLGGNTVNTGRNTVKAALYDPITFDTGGTSDWSLNNGAESLNYQLFSSAMPATFGKAAGLGEPEILEEAPSIEIGNRIWVDNDRDGIQDAEEPGIAGVTVQLLDNGANILATATTDVNGNYYFSSGMGTNTTSAIYGITQLIPNMQYIVRIPNASGGSQQGTLAGLQLTTSNANGGAPDTQADVRDSDGVLVGDNAEITVLATQIHIPGSNNHTFDFGFFACPPQEPYLICDNGSTGVTLTAPSGLTNVVWYAVSTGAQVGTGISINITSNSPGMQDGSEAYYYVALGSDGCETKLCCPVLVESEPCCALTVVCTPQSQTNCSPVNGSASVVASNAVGTVTYLWSSGETTSSISNKAAATYTVTVTDGGISGCSRTCEAVIANNASAPACTITVNTQPSCANLTGGDITVVPSPAGAYTYAWSDNGAATATRTGLTGGTYTVTVTNTTSNCTGVCNVTLTTPTNCCNITAIVPQNIECIDNGTPALITDNRIRFSANVTNTNTSLIGYNVTINGGTTITPNTNVPYGVTTFTLGTGTAGGGATFTVTVTDSATPGCTQTFQVTDPGGCNNAIPCPEVNCGTATIQVNGN